MREEVKTYAIRLNINETLEKRKLFFELLDSTKYAGVHPDYPYAYVVYRTTPLRDKALKIFSQHFKEVKLVRQPAFVQAKYLNHQES